MAAFARQRVAELEARYRPVVDAAPAGERTEALADGARPPTATLPRRARPGSGPAAGEQLCQHHCPVAHVAEQFPQLCEAETEVFARLLGTHVQRLATIAHGDGVCTTYVPTDPARPGRPAAADPTGGPLSDRHPRDHARRARGPRPLRVRLVRLRRRRRHRQARPVRGRRPQHLGAQERAASGCSTCGSRGCGCSARSRCRPGAPTCRASTSTTSSTSSARPRSRPRPGTTCPADIKNTYDRLGIPEAEKQRLVAGVAAQYESEVVYHQIREDLEEQGVLFLDTDTALREHEDLFKEYFGTVIPVGDNKFAALNTAVWSGGSFIYVPPGVKVDIPLQAYFRINTENMGQFERTLIIVDEGSYVHYVEGCTAPIYSSDSLHSAVVEIIVKKDARVRYTTIQNWSNNVYNLVTKRTAVQEGGRMEWVDGNIGSKVTMKYPAFYLIGEHAKGETLSVAFAGEGQHQDAGAKMVHAAPHTSSTIISKSVARGGGRTSYRGLVQVQEGAHGSQLDGEVRRAARRHDQPLRHLPLRRRPRGRRVDGPRGDGLQGQRRPALLPDEPRPDRGRGDGDDRARLRRADRQGAADGVRPRAQPADRAADGRGRRVELTQSLPPRSCHPRPAGSRQAALARRDAGAR